MSVNELSQLHRHYADLSERFRASWAFHQFVGSLSKVFTEIERPRLPADFQRIYSDLKQVSHNLTATGTDLVRERLPQVESQLGLLVQALKKEDEGIAPSQLRKFFRRVKSPDSKVLSQLVKFYLYSQVGGDWSQDRLDKVDFLVTRIACESGAGTSNGFHGERQAFRELLGGLAQIALDAKEDAVGNGTAEVHKQSIEEVRAEAALFKELDRLTESGLVPRYRSLKRGLGTSFFQPELLLEIVDTNLYLGERIQKLYEQEERRIVSEYQQVFELERDVPGGTPFEEELEEFHREIEDFEKQLQRDEMKLADLAQIRQRVRSLVPKMQASTTGSMRPLTQEELAEVSSFEPSPPLPEPAAQAEPAPAAGGQRPAAPASPPALIADPLRRITAALEDTNPEEGPRSVTVRPEIFPFRLEPREVVAYRRLVSGQATEPKLERFLLETAAVRVKVNEQAAEIQGLLDETATSGASPLHDKARETTALASEFLSRFQPFVDQAVLSNDLEEAQGLQVLRMRLMRDYSGLWLLVHKPRRLGLTLAG